MASKSWTEEELLYLEDKWGTLSIPTIGKKLERTACAVKEKAYRLGLGPVLEAGEYITLNQLCRGLKGYSIHSYEITSWVKKRGLPVKKKKVDQNSFRVVYLLDFWIWAEENRSFLDFSRMEPLIFGEEPPWVAEQRKQDFHHVPQQNKKPWTEYEVQRLIYLVKQQKYSWIEISKELIRSNGAIARKLQDLGIKDRPVKSYTHNKWEPEDFEKLTSGILNGESYGKISENIGKSEKAIRGKAYQIYRTENADKIRKIIKNKGESST
ncbi:MAG: hypothetical protein R3Y63_08805 [Eubacteriales bacterium]